LKRFGTSSDFRIIFKGKTALITSKKPGIHISLKSYMSLVFNTSNGAGFGAS
jgi:hypothetical protein